MYVAHSKGAQ